jgi:signal transduction histidine kinase
VKSSQESNERLLVLLPTAKDAERTVAAMAEANISSFVCSDVVDLCREISRGAGAALLAEENILPDHAGNLQKALRSEPSWSSFPILVLAREGRQKICLPDDLALHATLVERPLRMVTLKSVVDTALRHRRRQYQLKAVLRDLEQAKEELESRVAQRTAKLRETIGELESFSYSVSHDLRSPLRAMQGYAEILLEDESNNLSAEGKEYLSRIYRSASRLDLLVQDVLAYSKISKGEIDLAPIQVMSLIEDILRSYPGFSEKATITIEKPMPAVIGHEAYLTQCIANILGNAIKFVASGVQPEIHIWAQPFEEKVRIVFEDNGIGIAPANRQKIFQLFDRINPDGAFPGTGIGLAIVKKAVERMGGSVGVEPASKGGSRFWLTLSKA